MTKDSSSILLFISYSENFLDLMTILVQKIGKDAWNRFYWLNKMDICVEVCLHIHVKVYMQINKPMDKFSG